jgi:hypothetical protein
MRARSHQLLRLAAVACSFLAPSGCSNTLLFTTGTQLGIEVNAAEGGQQTAKVGYQRFEGTVMPIRKRDGTIAEEVYPVLAVYSLETGTLLLGGLTTTKIRQVFATGKAAVQPRAAEAVERAFRSLEGELIPEATLAPADELLALVDKTPDEKLAAVLGALREELVDPGEPAPASKAEAKAKIGDVALKAGSDARLRRALDKVRALLGP